MFAADPQPAASRWRSLAAAILIVLLAALPALISLLILGLMQVRWDAYVPWRRFRGRLLHSQRAAGVIGFLA